MYTFSRHSHNKLKQFLDLVENNVITGNRNTIEYLQTKFPKDAELIKDLEQQVKEHSKDSNGNSSLIEINDDSEKILIDDENEREVADISKHQALENVVLSIRNLMYLNNLKVHNEILIILQENESDLEYIFQHLCPHTEILQFSTSIATCNHALIIQVYCDIVLQSHILKGTDGISGIFKCFLLSTPQIICSALSKCIVVASEDHNIQKEFVDELSELLDEHKRDILRKVIIQSSSLNLLQLNMINKLVYSKMELEVIQNLVHLLSKNSAKLAVDRSFAFLLENVMTKNRRNVVLIKEEIILLVNVIPGILKLKLQTLLTNLEKKNNDISLSQITQF